MINIKILRITLHFSRPGANFLIHFLFLNKHFLSSTSQKINPSFTQRSRKTNTNIFARVFITFDHPLKFFRSTFNFCRSLSIFAHLFFILSSKIKIRYTLCQIKIKKSSNFYSINPSHTLLQL